MKKQIQGITRQAEETFLRKTLSVIHSNLERYGREVSQMREEIDEMLDHFHDDNPELINLLENTMTLHDHMKRALERNEKARSKPYFGRIVFYDETLNREESLYIGRGGISEDATHQIVVDWRAPVSNAYYENGLGKCAYTAPGGREMPIDLRLKRTYEIEDGKLLDYFDSEVIANDDLLTKYLAKNKQAVLGEIVATIQKEQNEIIRKSPYHNIIVQGVAGSGKTTVAMHRISYILYNYQERFKPDDFYIVGSNRILLNYITGVLPDLDVYGIRQMTMEQLFVRLLYEDWDEKKYRIADTHDRGQDSVKGSLEWFLDLQRYCDELEWNSISRESVYLNPRQFVEGIENGKNGVYDRTDRGKADPGDRILLVDGKAVERYILQNPKVSMQNKINMLNERLTGKIKEEFLGKGVKYTEAERKAILRAYRGRYGGKVWNGSIYKLYRDFLQKQIAGGKMRQSEGAAEIPDRAFNVYDLAALAYLYKRIKETEVISEAHHIVIDEAQDFGMMAYSALHFCIRSCTYTVMGDVSQNIHFGCGLNDWEELKTLLLSDETDSFNILKKSYRNTVEISNYATDILRHGQFSSYPAKPIIRHGAPVAVCKAEDENALIREAVDRCRKWQQIGFETIAVVCRDRIRADWAARELSSYIQVLESDPETAVFGSGIMVLPVEYTKGLEFDTVLILDPTRSDYPVDDGHAKLLYVAATRALHELCILHTGDLTGLIADPVPEKKAHIAAATSQKEKLFSAVQNLQTERNYFPQEIAAREGSPQKGRTRPMIRLSTSAEKVKAVPQKPQASNIFTGPGKVLSPSAGPEKVSALSSDSWKASSAAAPERQNTCNFPLFGDIPPTEKLRAPGHARIDLSVRWVTKQPDGLYLQSRYGILRISPVGSAILRMTFCGNGQPGRTVHPCIAVDRVEKFWMYRDSGSTVELTTDELALQVNKSTGAVRYMSMEENRPRDRKLLLAERGQECRLFEKNPGGGQRARLYLDLDKRERLYSFGPDRQSAGAGLRGQARYISPGEGTGELPFVLSDRGYGILLAADSPVFFCDIPAYGSHLCMENEDQIDFYFIAGRRQDAITRAYAYLLGKL